MLTSKLPGGPGAAVQRKPAATGTAAAAPATGALNENQLRAEHGLTARHGSGGVDTRSP